MRRNLHSLALLAALTPLPAHAATDGYGLGTQDQLSLDRRSVRIFADPAFQKRLGEVEAVFKGDPLASDPDAARTIRADAAAVAFNALQLIVNSDAERPALMWSGDAPHRWHGIDVPFASYGLNNPDNIYRFIPIDGASRYEIAGRNAAHQPAQTTYFLYNSIPGSGAGPIDEPIDGLLDKDMQAGPNGAFTITIDGDPANGRPNHIGSRADAKLLIIRESLSDWAKEAPAQLTVKRIAGPTPKPAATDGAVADETLSLAKKMVAYWMQYPNAYIMKAPANTVGKPNARGGKWGYTVNGRFALGADEALIVTLDPASASYVGFQLADPWAIPLEFVHHLSSLANAQAKPNPDGTYIYVLAAKDPGVWNWLDTEGSRSGVFGIRWQNLTDDSRIANAVRSAKLVKLAELPSALPAGTPMATPAERKAQIAARAENWGLRVQ